MNTFTYIIHTLHNTFFYIHYANIHIITWCGGQGSVACWPIANRGESKNPDAVLGPRFQAFQLSPSLLRGVDYVSGGLGTIAILANENLVAFDDAVLVTRGDLFPEYYGAVISFRKELNISGTFTWNWIEN